MVVSSGIVAERMLRVDGDEDKSAYAMRTRGSCQDAVHCAPTQFPLLDIPASSLIESLPPATKHVR